MTILFVITWAAAFCNLGNAFTLSRISHVAPLRYGTESGVSRFQTSLGLSVPTLSFNKRPSACVRQQKEGSAESVVAEVELRHALSVGAGSLSQRLRRTLGDLQDLYTSIEKDVVSAESVLAEKKKSMRLLEDRITRLKSELEQAVGDEGVAQDASSSAIFVGGGRIGQFLKANGEAGDVIVRSTSEYKFQVKERPGKGPSQGPIYLCVGNDALEELVEATPEDRRKDLVVMGEGLLSETLEGRWKLPAVTQALLGFAIAKAGDAPVDAVTPGNPQGHTYASGPWARDVAKRLKKQGMTCRFLDHDAMTRARLAHLAWISSVMIVGKLRQAATVGEAGKLHWKEIEAMVAELSTDAETGDFVFGQDYTVAVGSLPVVLKELEWRNGYFHRLSKAAVAEGLADPFPLHTAAVRRLKLDPKLLAPARR